MKDPNNVLQKALAKNEPVFVLRAQDKLSLSALSAYMHAARLLSVEQYPDELYHEMEKIHQDFTDWQNDPNNKIKFPD